MPDFLFEIEHGRDTGKIIAGVDEVGRGPLAGPVMAAAAIIPANFPNEIAAQIQDSKKMTAGKREALFPVITKLCPHAIAEASVEEIERLNILHASMLAMQRAIEKLHTTLDMVLVDGNRTPKLPFPARAIVKGDDRSLSIAAASIIAKVARDRLMQMLATEHPGYGWEKNAGYGTKAHLDAIERLGPTPWHRMGFAPFSQRFLITK